jgi:outer membrane lipoprotein LolB
VRLVCCISLNYRDIFYFFPRRLGSWDSAGWCVCGVRPIFLATKSFIYSKLAVVALSLWLTGCQTSALSGSDSGAIDTGDFETVGKLALRTPGESLSVRFRWRQAGESYDLELWGPFGQGRTRLVGDTQQMSVLDGQGQVLSQGHPELVVRQQIGWDLPLLALVSWAQGRPVAGAPVSNVSWDPQGRYTGFVQENWRVQYLAYYEYDAIGLDSSSVPPPTEPPAEAVVRPRPKTMALATGDYKVKVAFNRWQP